MPEDMPDRMPDRMPEDLPDRMPEDMPEDMPEHMPEDMPNRMPNRMPEDMSDRMPQDLPVRKCIDVMVGITRSKVIVCFPTSATWIVSNIHKDATGAISSPELNTHEPIVLKERKARTIFGPFHKFI